MKLIARITVSLIGAAAFTLLCLLLLYTAQAIVIAKTRDATTPIVETYLQPTRTELGSAYTFVYIWDSFNLDYAFEPRSKRNKSGGGGGHASHPLELIFPR